MLIGTPYLDHGRTREGVDCYGHVFLEYQEAGIDLPSFSSQYPDPLSKDRETIAGLICGNILLFNEVHEEDAEPLDVILFKVFGVPSHVAIFDKPNWMRNVDTNAGVVRERYDSPRWGSRIVGFYRYAGES